MLARTLRETRRQKGLSVEQLSKRSGVRGWVIREIEGESPSYVPSEGTMALLAEALRMPAGSCLRKGTGWSSGCLTEREAEEDS